jgi:phage terminase large subunit-like protein
VLQPHQKDILRLMSERKTDGSFRWRNLLYSTVKKSGKTTCSALYARWAAETWGQFQEVYNLGNKLKQAQDRAFKIARRSIELSPLSERKSWDLQATRLLHIPSGSTIEALPISASSESGGNQSLTLWTELWGFQYEEALLMWDELKPVFTRPLSQRFVDTYAGFEGMSGLLWSWWQLGLRGERLHDTLPVYGNESAGLIAYIDTGVEARRMPWQQGPEAELEYQHQAVTERPESYRRHYLNEWSASTDALINVALWDRLEDEPTAGKGQSVILGVDASVSGDCTALVVVGYDRTNDTTTEIETHIWTPPANGKLDYDLTLTPMMQQLLQKYRVMCVAYDPYQLHDLMTREAKRRRGTQFYAFPQGGERIKADTALVTRIQQGKFRHSGNAELREHVQNADGKASGDDALRIVKRAPNKHVDAVVALSMASWMWHEVKAPIAPRRRQMRTGFWGS